MLISFNWLKEYINLPDSVTPEEVALKLTMSTVEVEEVRKLGENLEKVVVGKVLSVEKHPNADKLKLCQVDVGKEKLAIVCGGSNVQKDMLVAVAKVGAKVKWHGEGELVEIKPTKIRDVESFGMICASTEIGLQDKFPLKDEKEILDLTEKLEIACLPARQGNWKLGDELKKVLGQNDVVFEIDNKSATNRPDLWGHYGLAREVAALYNKPLKPLNVVNQKIKKTKDQIIDLKIDVQDKENCYRYIGAVMGGIKIEPSPTWLQNRLIACGVRPINNIVDITNYITLELGRPAHAFDRRDMKNDTIIVRRAKKGEKFTTLDGQERELTDEMCLVCDAERAVDIGGVMGGLNSEIKKDTTEIILELANFNPTTIRKTANALGLRTEAAIRFEKGIAPYLAEVGMWRIITLVKELIPSAKLISKVIDVNFQKEKSRVIELSTEFLNKKIGIAIEKKTVIDILTRLGFVVKESKKGILNVTVPQWRPEKDISISEDLVEEVARIYGYGNIPTSLPVAPIVPPARNELRILERKVKEILALEFGFTEVYNYSFLSPDLMKKIGLDPTEHIELANPIAKDRPYLRHNLWPNLLENAENNLHRFSQVKLFEIGKVFTPEHLGMRVSEKSDELLPRQDLMLSAVYAEKGVDVPFYGLSEVLAGLMQRLGYAYELVPPVKNEKEDLIAHHGRGATIHVGKECIGALAELHPVAQKNLGIETRVVSLEINLDKLLACQKQEKIYQRLPEFPAVTRDIAFVVDKGVEHAQVVQALKKVDKLIIDVELFDVYNPSTPSPSSVAQGKKSMAYHLTYQSDERTLTSEEVDKVQEKVVKSLEKNFGAEIRQ